MEVVNEPPQVNVAPEEANENEAQNQDAPQEPGQDQGQGEPIAEQEPKIAKAVQSNVTLGQNLSAVYDLGVFVHRSKPWGKSERRGRPSGSMGAVRARTPCTLS